EPQRNARPGLNRRARAARNLAALLSATALTSFAAADPAPTPPPKDGLVTKGEVQSGSLLLASASPGRYVEAPLVAGHVDMKIAGPVIRTVVTQRFTNPSDKWVQGVYAFPLPEDAAVDTLKIVIGDRFIEGDIHERKEARQIFEEAAANGQKAG